MTPAPTDKSFFGSFFSKKEPLPSDALVFDSGIGGLGVVEELRAIAPSLRLAYLADTALFPYGALADEALVARLHRVIEAGIDAASPRLVVLACNTASTVGLATLRARFAVPFVGCVPPIKWAAAVTRTRRIGLLATPATVRRPYLRWLAARFAEGCEIVAHGAPGLAGLAEAAFAGETVSARILREELGPLATADGIDVVALGCTHYRFLLPHLSAVLGPDVTWLDPAAAVARQAARLLGDGAGGAGPAWCTGHVGPGEAAWAARYGFADATRLCVEGDTAPRHGVREWWGARPTEELPG